MSEGKRNYWVLAVILSLSAYFVPTLIGLYSGDGFIFVIANGLGAWGFVATLMLLAAQSKKWSGLVGCCILTCFALFLLIREMAGMVGADLGFVGGWAIYCWMI